MKKINILVMKFSSVVASLALVIGVSSVSSACYYWFNQPKVPQGMEKFRKDK